MGVSQSEKYVVVDAMGEAFLYFVTARKEALQILHHAFWCNFHHVLLLVSDTHSNRAKSNGLRSYLDYGLG